MSELKDAYLPYEVAQANFQEGLLQLFNASEATSGEEQEIERRVAEITREFLSASNVSTDIEFKSLVDHFRESDIPVRPVNAESYINYVSDNVVAHSVNTSSPRFIGHMTSALPYFVRPLSKLMVALNQNMVKMETSKALAPYERQVLAMLHRLIFNFSESFYDEHIQKSDSTLGIIGSGGTQANTAALWCARNAALGPRDGFAGIEIEGLPAALDFYGYKSAVVLGSSFIHYSLQKAVDLLGLGARNVIEVSTDNNHRINLQELRRTVAECRARKQLVMAIIGVAGTTESGAVDPLAEMAEIAREAGSHFHVDAAWGGILLFSEKHRHKLAGIELADTVTIDGHKQLYMPMGIGMLMLRHPQTAKAIEKNARYVIRAGSVDLGKRALEGSRPGMAFFLHAGLHLLGRQGYQHLIDGNISKIQYLANLIRESPAFELLVEPQTNILLYRYLPEPYRERAAQGLLTEADNLSINEFNERLQKIQRQQGYSFVSRTATSHTRYRAEEPITALRAVIANPLTTDADIESVLVDQLRIADEIASQQAV
jgi:glutamate decarboxylase